MPSQQRTSHASPSARAREAPSGDAFRAGGGRLRAALARCRSGLVAARHFAGRGPRGREQANAGHPDRTPFLALRGRLDGALRALDQARGAMAALAVTLERERQAALRESMLRREAEHRARTSLALAAGLLEAQAAGSSPAVAAALRLARTRVEALAALGNGPAGEAPPPGPGGVAAGAAPGPDGGGGAEAAAPVLPLGDHLRGVCTPLAAALAADGCHGEVLLEVEPAEVTPEAALALGLVVSELVTNAFRHGLRPGVPGTVWVQGTREEGGRRYRLTVADDGRGMPEGFSPGGPGTGGLGLRLVALLAGQVGAELSIGGGRCGARVTLLLPCVADAAAAGPAA